MRKVELKASFFFIIGLLLLASELQANTTIDLADNVADAYIYQNARSAESGHQGGVATGDVNGDGYEDLISSAYNVDVIRDEFTYLPDDKDDWTEDSNISSWKVTGKACCLQTSDIHISGSYSLSITRKGSGGVKLKRKFSSSLTLSVVDRLHFQVYAEDKNEKLQYIDIFAPNRKNRFRYTFEPGKKLTDTEWNKIDLDLSKFATAAGSPDWHNVHEIIMQFKGGSSGDIKIDQLYFDYYELAYIPGDQDSWTEEDVSPWSISGGASGTVTTSTTAENGNYSINATRTGTGTISLVLNLNKNQSTFSASSSADVLHFSVYVENNDEELNFVDIWASDWNNRIGYDFNPDKKLNIGWNQIDLNLSEFSTMSGAPDWNRIGGVVANFKNSSSADGNIKIDHLYFDHYGLTTTSSAGKVYLFYGKNIVGNILADTADVIIYGIDTGDLTGEYVTIGDINGDGFSDIIIGSVTDDGPDNEREDAGAVYVVFGSDALPSIIDLTANKADYIVYGADAGDYFGEIVSTADINSDGIQDLIIGALFGKGYENNGSYNGEIHIILGRENLSGILDLANNDADISKIIYGGNSDVLAAQASLGVGDVYNDGKVDLVFGIKKYSQQSKREVLVINDIGNYSGSIDLASFVPNTVVRGSSKGDILQKVAIGDVNGDSIDDIICGASGADGLSDAKSDVGEVYVIYGSSSLPAEIDLNSEDADFRIIGVDAGDNFGIKVFAKDVNDDGIDDILVIAEGGDGENNAKNEVGDAYVIYGNSNLSGTLDLADTPADITLYGVDAEDNLRDIYSGDISGDGINDVICGYRHGAGIDNSYPYSGEIFIVNGKKNW